MQAALAPWAQPTTSTSTQPPPPMTQADPTAPTMQAFGGTRAPVMNAGSAPPPANRSPLGLIIGLVVAFFVVGGGVAVAYVKLVRPSDPTAASSAPSSSGFSAPSASTSAAAASSAIAEDAGAKSGIAAKRDGGIHDAGSPPITDAAAPPAGPLKPSAYIGSMNVVGSTYDLDVVRAAIGGVVGSATQCFATAKLTDLHPAFEYHVTASGQVTGVGIRGSYSGADQAMVACAAARLAATHFSPNPKNIPDSIIIGLTVHYP